MSKIIWEEGMKWSREFPEISEEAIKNFNPPPPEVLDLRYFSEIPKENRDEDGRLWE